MSLPKVHPVILCGGSGKRLWPASRKSMPKQFVRLAGDASLLQQTIRRVEDISSAPPVLLTGHDYRFVVAEQAADRAQGSPHGGGTRRPQHRPRRLRRGRADPGPGP